MRAAALTFAALLAVAGQACGDGGADVGTGEQGTRGSAGEPAATHREGVPDRPADVTGTVALGADPSAPHLTDASDPYFQGMALLRGDPAVVDAGDGDVLDPAALTHGARVEVWVEGPCAESYPVQCQVAAVAVTAAGAD